MEKIMYNNKVFKDVFPDYNSFEIAWNNSGLSDGYKPNNRTFQILFIQYCSSHIAFTEDEFKLRFCLEMYTYAKEFEETSVAIDKLMSLSPEEMAISYEAITNFAEIPETELSTDAETVNFISNQQKSINKKGKLQVLRELITNKRSYTTRSFLRKFQYLFIRILSPAYTFAVEEDEEE